MLQKVVLNKDRITPDVPWYGTAKDMEPALKAAVKRVQHVLYGVAAVDPVEHRAFVDKDPRYSTRIQAVCSLKESTYVGKAWQHSFACQVLTLSAS